MTMPGKTMLDARRRVIQAEADLAYVLTRFGDKLSEDEGYSDVNGMEAVWLYLIRTHHWTPATVRAMTPEDMRFVLEVEMQGFTIDEPKE